jgi:hypothetical protein
MLARQAPLEAKLLGEIRLQRKTIRPLRSTTAVGGTGRPSAREPSTRCGCAGAAARTARPRASPKW